MFTSKTAEAEPLLFGAEGGSGSGAATRLRLAGKAAVPEPGVPGGAVPCPGIPVPSRSPPAPQGLNRGTAPSFSARPAVIDSRAPAGPGRANGKAAPRAPRGVGRAGRSPIGWRRGRSPARARPHVELALALVH